VLYGAAALTFFLVGLVSSADSKRNAIAWILLAMGLAAALMLIVDLDRPHEGVLTVSKQALRVLQQQLATPAP